MQPRLRATELNQPPGEVRVGEPERDRDLPKVPELVRHYNETGSHTCYCQPRALSPCLTTALRES